MSAQPVRLQLSRRKGFDLQALSRTTNGLEAVNVARPSRWGNPFRCDNEEGWPVISCGEVTILKDDGRDCWSWDEVPAMLVKLFRERSVDRLPNLSPLRGKNVACWCGLDKPCHGDVYLDLANR